MKKREKIRRLRRVVRWYQQELTAETKLRAYWCRQVTALREQLATGEQRESEGDDNWRAHMAEIERDAALSDVAARDERIRVLEGLLTQWLDYPGASFAALRRLAEDTRKALVARAGQCDHCGTDLVAVRPGKEQCEECEEVAK